MEPIEGSFATADSDSRSPTTARASERFSMPGFVDQLAARLKPGRLDGELANFMAEVYASEDAPEPARTTV